MQKLTAGAAGHGDHVGRENDRVAFEIAQIPGRARWDPLIDIQQQIGGACLASHPALASAGEQALSISAPTSAGVGEQT